MANIYVEAKGPKGVQAKESLLPAAVSGFMRGLAVVYGSDQYHAALASALGQACVGILAEDAISTLDACAVIEFGQCVAQIGANITAQQLLTVNAAGQLIPAGNGQAVLAVALEPQTYVSPGSYANVFVLGLFGFLYPGSPVSGEPVVYETASGAIPLVKGTYVLNGAAALAETLATPTTPAQDGIVITLVAGTAHAHKVTTAANKINGVDDTITFAAVGDNAVIESVAGIWVVKSLGGPTPASLSEV
jgi:hypothetical protein